MIVFCFPFISYAFLSKANIPVKTYDCDMMKQMVSDSNSDKLSSCKYIDNDKIQMKVSFAVYLVCLISFVGWWAFMVFAGVGLSSIPIDLVVDWKTRPIKMN